ncbi:uncharacterized protein LOC123194967 [Mangifera indica]|uniref:uncharacterized protein LOC123194967 n=1 Tax=Mangifera indica TaxID=29780 RepID=UPI001CFC40A8|nr:uncharacterized protein LOC123194967 [Mangifera indica]
MGALEKTDHHHPHLHVRDPEEEEEALSLSDLPLDENNGKTTSHSNNNTPRRTSSSSSTESGAPEFFEFLSNLSSEMCAAEDLIFCGKLIPLNNSEQNPISLHHHRQQQQPQHSLKAYSMSSIYEHKQGPFRRRSESLSELQSSRSKSKILRSSRSLDYQKLHRVSSSKTSSESDMEQNPSVRSVGKSDNFNKFRVVKPRWYLFMFGMVKFPPEMDLRDIKSRQFRRNSSVMFPPLDASGNFPANRSSATGEKTSWRFLKALSCRDDASVAATTPLCMPHA